MIDRITDRLVELITDYFNRQKRLFYGIPEKKRKRRKTYRDAVAYTNIRSEQK